MSSRTVPASVLLMGCLVACDGAEMGPGGANAGPRAGHDADVPGVVEDEDDFQGCPDRLPSFAPGLQATGEQLVVEVVAAVPAEPERYLNRWTVELRALDGAPAPDAGIVRGQTFMPVHGHDGRVQPQMTALSEPGQVQIDRLNFTMRGPWEVRLWLRSRSTEDDYVVFEVCVAK
jgi:YtkA-like